MDIFCAILDHEVKKNPSWLRLTATDIPGHGGTLRVKSSVKKVSGQVPELPIPNSNEEPYPRSRLTFLLSRPSRMISAKR